MPVFLLFLFSVRFRITFVEERFHICMYFIIRHTKEF